MEFENKWQQKLANGLDEIEKKYLLENLPDYKDASNLIKWTSELLTCLENNLSNEQVASVMFACSCTAPRDMLEESKKVFAESNDLAKAHLVLQNNFDSFIIKYKDLDEDKLEFLRDNGWGMAGILEGNTITVTKIPKQFDEYFRETHDLYKKYYYCHCNRIRNIFKTQNEINISPEYCNCGAGFYKEMWEYITSKPVEINIVKSILKGGEICTFKIQIKK